MCWVAISGVNRGSVSTSLFSLLLIAYGNHIFQNVDAILEYVYLQVYVTKTDIRKKAIHKLIYKQTFSYLKLA
jgi:hypothetical protein